MKSFSKANRVLQGLQVILLAVFAVGAPMFAAANDDVEELGQSYSFEFLTFKGDTPPQTFLEVFCQIPAAQKFQFIKVMDGFVANYEIAITILDAQNAVVANLRHVDSVKVGAYSEIFLPWEPQLIRFTFLLIRAITWPRFELLIAKRWRIFTSTKKSLCQTFLMEL